MATAVLPARPSPFAVFRNREFTLLWLGQLISTAGSALTSLTSSILVYRLTGSALSVGLMLAVTAVPTLLVGLVAGVFVDRFDRKKILIGADLIRAALVFMIPFLLPHGIVWLYGIVALSSTVGQFYDPAHESVIPEIASEQELASADSLMAISSFGAMAIGFAAAGLIASRFAIEWAFYIDAATFVFSTLCILLIRLRPLEVEGKTSAGLVLRNLGAGLSFLRDNRMLRSLATWRVPVLLSIGMYNALILPFTQKALHATEFQYGLQEGLTSMAFIIGSLLMIVYIERLREGQWMVISFIGMGIATTLYAQMHIIPVAIAMTCMAGFIEAPYKISERLVLQRNTPREMRGRVNSAMFVSRDVLYIVGMLAAGLGDLVNIRLLMTATGIIFAGSGVLAQFMPGLGQPAAEWKRALALLRTASTAARAGIGRAATLADFDKLVGLVPSLSGMSAKERGSLVAQARVVPAPAGTTILKAGEKGEAAYFVLEGRAVAGIARADGSYRILNPLEPGEFFGEIAALTGAARTANVVAEEDMSLVEVPAPALRSLMARPDFSQWVLSTMNERLVRVSVSDLPRFAGLDQEDLRDLREEHPTPLPDFGS